MLLLLCIFYFFRKDIFIKSIKIHLFLFYFFSLLYFHYHWYETAFYVELQSLDEFSLMLLLAFLQIVVIFIFYRFNPTKNNKWIYYILFIIFFINYFSIGIFENQILNRAVGAIFYILQMILFGLYLIFHEKYHLFHFIVIVIILRILIIYIEIFKDFTTTGLGLLGLRFLLILSYFVYRKMIHFLQAKGFTK